MKSRIFQWLGGQVEIMENPTGGFARIEMANGDAVEIDGNTLFAYDVDEDAVGRGGARVGMTAIEMRALADQLLRSAERMETRDAAVRARKA